MAARGAKDAFVLYWAAFAFFVAGVGIGTAWDRRWHASHPFEDFFSPPHLFIYSGVLLTVGTVAAVAFSPVVRRWFGEDTPLPLLPLAVPAPVLLLGCGLASLGVAGLLDGVWHSTFGLDETGWSLPHALLGHGIMLSFWGFAACRLALERYQPSTWLTRAVVGWVLLATAQDLIGGPLVRNLSPGALRLAASLPVLAADERAQHTFRIYLAWHVDRTNLLFLPVAAFTLGFGLALVGRLYAAWRPTQGEAWLLLPAAVVALAPLATERQLGLARLWEPLPYLVAALAFLASRRLGVPQRWAWIAAGAAGSLWLLVFVHRPLLVLLAGTLALPGAWVGECAAALIVRPTRGAILGWTAVVAGVMPASMGALDLYLRFHTP